MTRDLVAEQRDHAPPPDRTTMLITDPDYKVPEGHALVLRVCHSDLSSSRGFAWPAEGEVRALDWSPTKECGRGLHGWLWGVGDIGVANGVNETDGARWLVVEVDIAELIDLTGKAKFPRGVGSPIIHGTATAGYSGTATAGARGTATAGARGTATAGYRGTIMIARWDVARDRYRWVVGEVDDVGIEANVPYVLDGAGKLVRKVVP